MSPDQLQPALIISISISAWHVLVWQHETKRLGGVDIHEDEQARRKVTENKLQQLPH